MSGPAERWLPRRRRESACLGLYCLPFAGGGSAAFHGLAGRIHDAIEVVPLSLPGRERRLDEAAHRDMGSLVDALARALDAELERRPYALLGHSLGALVAFELARRRRADGRRAPVHLFASACRAPHRLSVQRPIHGLADAEFVAALSAMGGMPREVLGHAELLSLLLPALRADFQLYETYRFEPGEPLDCPISALGGESDPLVPRADVDAWRAATRGPFATQELPGGHFFLQERQALVARILNEALMLPAEASIRARSDATLWAADG